MPSTHEQDLLVVRNISNKDFTTTWGQQPFTVPANGEKVYPRFIAQHIANHLTDAVLLAREDEMAVQQGVRNLKHSILGNKLMRDEVKAKILPEVYQYYLNQPQLSEQERVAQKIEQANASYAADVAAKAAETPPPEPTSPPAETEDDDEKETFVGETKGTTEEVSLLDPKKKKPTKAQLIEDCEQLGIELNGDESYAELVAKLKEF